ncbi:hypothetical protein FJP69_19610 [Stenotrophomonas maltophilia]|nr:hypothetical protein FJP69_19610 [Stenotrophomonas maltophilia]
MRIHLLKVPGSKANLGAVVRFAAEQLNHSIAMPPLTRRREAEPKHVLQMRALLKKIKACGNEAAMEDLQRTIAVAFQIPVRAIKAGTWWPEKRRGRWCVMSHEEIVRCPAALQDVVMQGHAAVQASSQAQRAG